jgi:hypothetical protein
VELNQPDVVQRGILPRAISTEGCCDSGGPATAAAAAAATNAFAVPVVRIALAGKACLFSSVSASVASKEERCVSPPFGVKQRLKT